MKGGRMHKQKKANQQHKAKEVKPLLNRLNLKPNEAYEPGIGKYALTESELRSGGIGQHGAEKNTTKSSPGAAKASAESGKGSKANHANIDSKYNGQGISHYPGEAETTEEQEQRIRSVNTNMHNNW